MPKSQTHETVNNISIQHEADLRLCKNVFANLWMNCRNKNNKVPNVFFPELRFIFLLHDG